MYLGIDIGGTNIKFGVVREDYSIIKKYMISSEGTKDVEHIVSNIINKCIEIYSEYPYKKIGVGFPGTVDTEHGICVEADNLPFENVPLAEILERNLKVKSVISNDALCALYGEICVGIGKQYQNFIMLTLGTGVGAGICINGKPYVGKNGMAGEVGHMSINYAGELCSNCGNRGCFEHYASVTALLNQAQKAAKKEPNSLLAKMIEDGISGKAIFDAMYAGCEVAENVLNQYTEYLSIGIKSLKWIFDPEAIVIGGAISAQKEYLENALKRGAGDTIEICVSQLGNDAGIIGAAAIAGANGILYKA